jgi:hypothetical protein
MSKPEAQHPTSDERATMSIRTYKGVELGIGQADPGAAIAAALEAKFPGHLILIQRGTFLQGYDRTAFALHTLKQYKLKLVGTALDAHIRIGFPMGGFKRRLWAIMNEFGIPFAVSLGNQAEGRTVHVSENPVGNAAVLSAVSDQVVADVIGELRARGELNKATAKQLLANPDTSGFKLKSHAAELDEQLLQDIIKMPRDLRVTYGENLRACMARIMRCIFAYGLEDNKVALLKAISADVDLVKHYLAQGQGLRNLKVAFEHRVALAVDLGKLTGGLLRAERERA